MLIKIYLASYFIIFAEMSFTLDDQTPLNNLL